MRAYVSHPIRGSLGSKATPEDELKNMAQAMEFARNLKGAFPNVEFYVPAEHNEFVMEAYFKHHLSEDAVLDTDIIILQKRDVVVVYAPERYISSGMKRETDAATRSNIPIVIMENESDFSLLRCVIEKKKQ